MSAYAGNRPTSAARAAGLAKTGLAEAGWALARLLGPPLLAMWLVLLASRTGLALWLHPRLAAQDAWGPLALESLRFDGVMLGLIWFSPAAALPWLLTFRRGLPWAVRITRLYALVWFIFLVFMECATPAFVMEYDSRPNYLFVEYLRHVREVAPTVVLQYPWATALASIALPLAGWAFWRWATPTRPRAPIAWTSALCWSVVLLSLFASMARGTFGHRPANPALTAITQDNLVNQWPLASGYTLLYALRQSLRNESGGVVYGHMPRDEMLAVVREEMGIPAAAFTAAEAPTRRRQAQGTPLPRPYNLVVILEESMGAEFVGRLGGLGVTPNLDRLAGEGIWFEQLYATGTRSVRGIEAVVAGFPPTSSESTVKLQRAQKDFFTLAQFLKAQGYRSTFLYGGESHFDNMRGFFMGNGFDAVIDENDFPDSAFHATWGVDDVGLLDRADAYFSAQSGPFFGLVFTSSNHAPFEFPDGAIELHDSPRSTVNNAVKYADHALGRFFEKARQSAYWKNTVFLVVADHNSRVYGDSLLPVQRFHIPGLILGGPVQPDVVHTQASQIDLAPTLISLLGLHGEHPMIGRDLTDPAQRQRTGRAIMQFDKTQAYMEGDRVVLLRPDLPPALMRYDVQTGQLSASTEAMPDLTRKAMAHALFAPQAYREGWHR